MDLIIADPPYNVGVTTQVNGKKVSNAWDKIENYIPWCISWVQECQRVLKPTGVLYIWHNDMRQIAELLSNIGRETDLEFRSFCIWDKGDSYRANCWHNRKPDGRSAMRSWFNICEYCLHFFKAPKGPGKTWANFINDNSECYRPLKDWYTAEKERLGITDHDIAQKYIEATAKKPHMLRHYFKDSQFEIPTQAVWESVYIPLGFEKTYEAMREEYEAMREEHEAMRNIHRCDPMHCNVWHMPPIPTQNRYHTCQKPVEILERLCRVSSPPGGVVLDPFMGSGSTGVACANTGREFIGVELDPRYYQRAVDRLNRHWAQRGA